jgi:hypothetical protein
MKTVGKTFDEVEPEGEAPVEETEEPEGEAPAKPKRGKKGE